MKIVEKQVIRRIDRLQSLKNIEQIKGELYSIFSILILSKQQFLKNVEIKEFLKKLNIDFKDYVFVSRTMILSRTLREINSAEEGSIINLVLILCNELEKEEKEKEKESANSNSKKKKKNEDYILDILDRYTRNDKK